MSIKDRLRNKTDGLFIPSKADGGSAAAATPLRTGPGQMLMVNSLMKESNERVALLEQQIKEFEGALPVRLINADKIVVSKWANRVEQSFTSKEFLELKEEIATAQGNVQPIKVRPLKGGSERFEIIFGHRRHRACLDLKLQVLALVEEISDIDLFKEMDRENRNRSDPSAWEQGCAYKQALNEGLFSSLGELSKELGVDKGNASKALRLAELPDVVVNAFASPLELQFRMAKVLGDALAMNRELILDRAKNLCDESTRKHSPKKTLAILLGTAEKNISEKQVVVDGKSFATISTGGDKVSVDFVQGALSEEKIARLQGLLEDLLKE
jgi:ParB family chromosome partitioning protein